MPILYLLKKIHVQVDLCSNPYYSRVNCSSVWCAQHCDEYQQKVRYWGKARETRLRLVWAGDEEDEKGVAGGEWGRGCSSECVSHQHLHGGTRTKRKGDHAAG